ncbi:MAG: Arm DNA-binding domain-containing protein [Synergistaceae bacterium]|jgi:hypothetical protein|nr:Arm DNA-binding domain-containing protein [Synergistaceae bacterium]
MLSDAKIKNLKKTDKRYYVIDTEGLYLYILPSGKKSWRFRYVALFFCSSVFLSTSPSWRSLPVFAPRTRGSRS